MLSRGIKLTQAPLLRRLGRPLSALDPAAARGPRHLSRGGRGAGQPAARAGRRGRRERGRTGGPRLPTARLRSAGRAGPRASQPLPQPLAQPRSLRADSLSTRDRGARRADPKRPAPGRRARPTPHSQPPLVPAGGGTRRERSWLLGLPPATRRAYARGRNFLKETGGPNPRLPGAPTRPPGPSPLWGRERAATDLHTTHVLFPWAVTDCKF